MPVLIRLFDFGEEKLINATNLLRFVREKKRGEFFFDLPKKLHDQIIDKNEKLVTSNQ